jgi:undecaprenyl diphosphate synthase
MTSEGSAPPSLPRHVAIIMDGNGRWASLRGLPRVEGHRMGVRSVRAVVECARELRIPCLTLYAFSLENWGRPEPEVLALMTLLKEFLLSELSLLLRHRIRLRVIGETSSLPFAVRQVLERTVSATAGNTEMTLTLGLSYAGRNEIVRTARRLAAEAAEGKIAPEGIPDPDLVIRTSGELRISNFLLWQSAYAEFAFTDVLWPDFGKAEFLQALEEYSRRHRRFGLTGEQAAKPPGK